MKPHTDHKAALHRLEGSLVEAGPEDLLPVQAAETHTVTGTSVVGRRGHQEHRPWEVLDHKDPVGAGSLAYREEASYDRKETARVEEGGSKVLAEVVEEA